MESSTVPEVVHPLPADSEEDFSEDFLQQDADDEEERSISFDDFMQRVKAQESFSDNHIDMLYKLAGSQAKEEHTEFIQADEDVAGKPAVPSAKPAAPEAKAQVSKVKPAVPKAKPAVPKAKPAVPKAAKVAETKPSKSGAAAKAALSNEVTKLNKLAANANSEAAKTSKQWNQEVKPLDEQAEADAQEMLKDAKEEKRQAELKVKERKDK